MFQRKLTAAVAVVAASVALAGCGRSGADGAAPQAAETISSGKATGTVTIWAQGNEATQLPKVLEGFKQENPDVTINVTELPWQSAQDKYRTSIASGDTPDIGMIGSTWTPAFASALAPVPAAIDMSGMFEGAVDNVTVNGAKVAVPLYLDTRVVYYRKDLAEKAGITTPPTDFAGFKAMAKAMQTEAGAKWGIVLPNGGPNTFEAVALPAIWSNGGDIIDGDDTRWTFDSPEVVEALDYVKSFYDEGIADRNPNPDLTAIGPAFISGETPMFVSGPFTNFILAQSGGPDFASKVGVFPVPTGQGGASTTLLGGAQMGVFQKAENKDAAWKVLQYLSKPENQVAFYEATTDLPAVQSAYEDPALAGDQTLSTFEETLQTAKGTPNVPTWIQVSAAADQALERVAKAGQSPEDAMAELQATAEGIGTED
ncbi:extracellular solute-binding protein [Kineococcus sp. R8]|uniref:extracellular solute-binding protein n=1 Tax=Kineococcus siccus TaxID=2696567 RepID=UPI0014127017|nr:extracellular solute-binding protein [Kineococcus siccus]NAZ81354.1 extracellular solute-binding protein [Kineococcus siccus]